MSGDLLRGIPLLRLERCAVEKTGLTLSAYLASEHIRQAAGRMLEMDYFLEDVSLVQTAEGYLAVYHFDHFKTPGRVALRVLVDNAALEIPTISDIYQGASWHERECRDFFGISFGGHDNLLPLLLPAEAEFHPLRKEEKALKAWSELVEPGEVLQESPDFTLFAPVPEVSSEASLEQAEAKSSEAAPK